MIQHSEEALSVMYNVHVRPVLKATPKQENSRLVNFLNVTDQPSLYSVKGSCIDKLIIYTLFTKTNLIVVVDKAALINEQASDEFVQFIRHKCNIFTKMK